MTLGRTPQQTTWHIKSHDYLIICNAFSKYPFVFKVMSKSAQSLCTHLLELILQYGPPMSLSTDNGPPFASDELPEFLMHHHITHHTSSPHFSRSNGFIERQVRTIKTALNTALLAKNPLESVLLDLRSMPIGPKMPSPCEMLHNKSIQWPGRPSLPIDMEQVKELPDIPQAGPVWPIQQGTQSLSPIRTPSRPRSPIQVTSRWWVHPRDHHL